MPLDVRTYQRLRDGWEGIQEALIAAVDRDYGVYDGRTFKHDRFAAYLARGDSLRLAVKRGRRFLAKALEGAAEAGRLSRFLAYF